MNHNEQIFVLGGAMADVSANGRHGYLNDVWVSSDLGKTWEITKERSPRFSPRRGHATVMDNSNVVMFIIGGFCGRSCFNRDWWNSENGDVWNNMGDAPWSARHGHAAVMTSQDVLVMTGGHNGTTYLNDVWVIHDPAQKNVQASWYQVPAESPWSPRYGHAAIVDAHDNILLIGGFSADKSDGLVECYSDVWRSSDSGQSWSLVTADAGWPGRYQHAAQVTLLGDIFIIGGIDVDLQRCQDMWRSKDNGRTWDDVSPSPAWTARYEHAVVADKRSELYLIGGLATGDLKFNDIWKSVRTCSDNVNCDGATLCRDGSYVDNEAFLGISAPICVDICSRSIFTDCEAEEACRHQDGKPVCINPCDEIECHSDEVCEVHERDSLDENDEQRKEAEAYCKACNNPETQTKHGCDKLRQCKWSPEDEACLMRCSVFKSEGTCTDHGACAWKDGECADK